MRKATNIIYPTDYSRQEFREEMARKRLLNTIFVVVFFFILGFLFFSCSSKTDACLLQYEQELNQKKAIEYLPMRMVGRH